MNVPHLLECAAKAAGYTDLPNYKRVMDQQSHLYGEFALVTASGTIPSREWNPLIDDGDALRLAARLRFDIEIDGAGHVVSVYSPCGHNAVGAYEEGESRDDEDVAAVLRETIVKCAARIGDTP